MSLPMVLTATVRLAFKLISLILFQETTIIDEDHGMMGQFVVVDDLSITPEVRTEAQRMRIGDAN